MSDDGDVDPFAYSDFRTPPKRSKSVSPDAAAKGPGGCPSALPVDTDAVAGCAVAAAAGHGCISTSGVAADLGRQGVQCGHELASRHEPKGPVARVFDRVLPHGGMASSMFNLASATLGASIIALPGAFAASGAGVAILFLVMCAVATIYSIHILMVTSQKTGLISYEEMARVLLGHRMDYAAAFLMFAFCFGTTIAYVIALGDLFRPFAEFDLPAAFSGSWGNRLFVSLVWLVGMFPLALPREINSLRYASCFGVLSILFFVVIMVWHASANGLQKPLNDRIDYAVSGNKAVLGLSLIMFAFLCQVNAFEIYYEMHDRSVEKMTRAATFSMGSCLILYIISGFVGYADFGRAVHGAVLEDYHPRESTAITVSYVCLIVKLCAAYALCIHPARDALFYVLNWGNYMYVPPARRIAVCVTMAVTSLVGGLFIPSLEVVFGLLGSLCGGVLGFVFPALFFMYSGEWTLETVGTAHFIATWMLLISGAFAIVFGTAASIYVIF